MDINKKKFVLPVLAVSVVFVLAAVKWFFFSPEKFTWQEGDRISYSINTTDVISAGIPGAGDLYKRITLSGILNMRLLEVRDGRVRAAIQISPVRIKVGPQEIPAIENIYSNLFFAEISDQGEFLNFDFSNEIAPDDENNLINTVRSLQFVIKNGFSKEWNFREKDANGTAEVNYTAEEHIIRKRKQSYISLRPSADQSSSDTKIDIKNSLYTANYDSSSSWISEMNGQELLVFISGNNTFLKTSSRISLKKLASIQDPSLAIWNDGLSFGEMRSRWSSLPKNRISFAMASEQLKIRQKIGNKKLDEYLKDFFSTHNSFRSAALTDIVNYLRAFPGESAMVPDLLLTMKLNQQQRAILTHALARAAHPEAQNALVRIMRSPAFLKENRVQAVIAFSDIPLPQKSSVSSLWETYNDRGAGKEISDTAILSLGSISKTFGRSESEKDRDLSDEIKERIGADLKSVSDMNRQVALLHAACNTGDDAFIEPVSSFFSNDNPNIRSSAASSLAHLPSGKVDDILCAQLNSEKDINVRGSLVSALEQREPTDQSVGTVLNQIGNEENEIVRGEMYNYLLKNREKPGVREKLAELKKTESSLACRLIINRALNSKK